MGRFDVLVSNFENNLDNYETLKPVGFSSIIWTLFIGGLVTLAAFAVCLVGRIARKARSSVWIGWPSEPMQRRRQGLATSNDEQNHPPGNRRVISLRTSTVNRRLLRDRGHRACRRRMPSCHGRLGCGRWELADCLTAYRVPRARALDHPQRKPRVAHDVVSDPGIGDHAEADFSLLAADVDPGTAFEALTVDDLDDPTGDGQAHGYSTSTLSSSMSWAVG